MDPLIFAAIVYGIVAAVGYAVLATGVWLGRKEMQATKAEVKAIKDIAVPLMLKANLALDRVSELEAVPATVVLGIEKVMRDQLETKGSALRAYTSALLTEGISALDETLSKKMEPLAKILPAASTILSKEGVSAHVDKAEGRKIVAGLIEEFGPFKGLVNKFVPKSAMDDPAVFLGYLAKMKNQVTGFMPALGPQIDQLISNAILGGGTPAEGMAGLGNVGGLVRMLPAGVGKSSSTADYMSP